MHILACTPQLAPQSPHIHMMYTYIYQHDMYTYIHIYELAHIHIYGPIRLIQNRKTSEPAAPLQGTVRVVQDGISHHWNVHAQ